MATLNPRARYIISRYSDPVFAVFIGISAAFLRIRNEEIEKRSGLPSASMVISPQQKKRMEDELEKGRPTFRNSVDVYRSSGGGRIEGDFGLEQTSVWFGESSVRARKREEVGYLEVLRLYWQRIVWKLDYEWNGRGKELVRKDGKLV